MKKKTKNLIYPLILVGLVLIFSGSCKKDSADDSANTVKDIDGNVYHTVTIGSQVWMVENLKVKHYNNGDPIGDGTLKSVAITDPIGQVYIYNNDMANFGDYGFLYNWYAIADKRGLAPKGWHVATDGDFINLVNSQGGDYLRLLGDTIAGGPLKETGVSHWGNANYPNIGATNKSGWTGLPGGQYSISMGTKFTNLRQSGSWWTSTTTEGVNTLDWAYKMSLSCIEKGARRSSWYKIDAYSVRCVSDNNNHSN